MDYRAIRTARYKYIHWMRHPDGAELYDLEADPLELHNLVGEPRLASVKRGLQEELGRLVLEALGLREPK
jgi:arylsulfatase A-like enzyme